MSSYGSYESYGIASSSKGVQMFTSAITLIIIFSAAFIADLIFTMSTDKAFRFKTLLDYTAASDENVPPIRQDISKYPEAIPIGLSVNERSGIEFSYSFYLMVNPTTFTGEDTLKHVFHKGYPGPWPLMAPGVFIRGSTNTMRIFMNTHQNPYTYVDVKNIPVQKWFHVVLNCFKGGLDVYVNGNLANRISFKNTIPYQNFQDIIFFSKGHYSGISSPRIAAIPDGEVMNIDGSFQGLLSRVKYARYSLSVAEIQKLMGEGPSNKRKTAVQEMPPYMADSWWANQSP
jgi:hypothetical protein